eukprot:1460288-Pyramimonas_sp.AAC.1
MLDKIVVITLTLIITRQFSELWPPAEKVLGKFPHLYNVRELVDPVMNETEETSVMGQITAEDFEE